MASRSLLLSAALAAGPAIVLASPAPSSVSISLKTSPAASPSITTSEHVPTGLGFTQKYTPAAGFPSGAFAAFWKGHGATQTSVEPQPKVSDPVSHKTYPLKLSDPDTIWEKNVQDPVILPPSEMDPAGHYNKHHLADVSPKANLSTPASIALRNQTHVAIVGIIGDNSTSTCRRCVEGLKKAQDLVRKAPWEAPHLMISLCNAYDFPSYGTCAQNFGLSSDGDVYAQVLHYADLGSQDAQWICSYWIDGACDTPPPLDLSAHLDGYFAKPKPENAVAPAPGGGEKLKVLQLTDFHLDPRYTIGSEAACDDYLCCQPYSTNGKSNTTTLPAARYGAYKCDVPYDLAGAALQSLPHLTGTTEKGFDFTLYTGDLVSHHNDNQLSRAYVEYEETAIFGMIKNLVKSGPVYAALGNHDSWPQATASQLEIKPKYIGEQFSYNYEHLASLWADAGWIDSQAEDYARLHYGAYSIKTKEGLRIISWNTDFVYTANVWNSVDYENPDSSGIFRWMADELQKAEDAGERVWIIGHVPTGWDGYSGMQNPTNLFAAIVDRYAPHVIAEILFGHNHEDQLSIFYANNASHPSAHSAIATQWLAPSLTPLSNLNSGFRVYEVDSKSFNIMDSYTWFSNVSAFPELDKQDKFGAPFEFLYSARQAYGKNIDWSSDLPINATWWHKVTEQMEKDPALADLFNTYQGKNSVETTNCTSTPCVVSKICYMRSGSTPLAGLCPYGSDYGSVQ